MLAVVYHGPDDLRLENVPKPTIGPSDILIKVSSASICGTDLRIWHGNHSKFPMGTIRIPGHEIVGKIAQIGSNVHGYSKDQSVFIAPNIGCGHCYQCVSGNNNRCTIQSNAIGITLDGGFAEYVLVPASAVMQGNVIPIFPGLDAAEASLIEPFACVLRGQDVLKIQPGESVLIMGAGPIGIMHIQLAILRGAGRVIVSEPLEERADQAFEVGANRVVIPTKENLAKVINEETKDKGADVVIVAAPAHAAQEEALQLAGMGGRINFFGGLPKDRSVINFDSNIVHYKELTVAATTACSTGDCIRAAGIINSGSVKLTGLISARYSLTDAIQAYKTAEDRKSLKVVLEP